MPDTTIDILNDRSAFVQLIDRRIKALTNDCVRQKIVIVTTLPNQNKVGVTEPYNKEIFIPYVSDLVFQLGDNVIMQWNGSLSNAYIARKSGMH